MTPEQINTPFQVLGSQIKDQRMSADIKWAASDASEHSRRSTQVHQSRHGYGPLGRAHPPSPPALDHDKRRRDGGAGEFEQHSSYGKISRDGVFTSILCAKLMAGTFFADMTKATQPSSTTLALTGTSNIAVKPQPGSYRALVVLHALLLGVAFVIVFPSRCDWFADYGGNWPSQFTGSFKFSHQERP